MKFEIENVTDVSQELSDLFDLVLTELDQARGGFALLRDIMFELRVISATEVLGRLVQTGSVIGAREAGVLVGMAAVSPLDQTRILGMFVATEHRRRGCARAMLNAMIERLPSANDAWALPGDRATKSLYESAGWRARRLTMSGDS